jgi:hypothetical protein
VIVHGYEQNIEACYVYLIRYFYTYTCICSFRCDILLAQCTVMDYLKSQETAFPFQSYFLLRYWKGNNCCSTNQTSRYILHVPDGFHKYSFCVVCKQGTWFGPATINKMKIQVFWDVTLCRWVKCYRRFEAGYCLPFCVHAVQWEWLWCNGTKNAVRFFEKSVGIYKAIRHNVTEDLNFISTVVRSRLTKRERPWSLVIIIINLKYKPDYLRTRDFSQQ